MSEVQLLRLHMTFHTLPLFYLLIYNLHVDAYAHENKVTVEIDLLANKL